MATDRKRLDATEHSRRYADRMKAEGYSRISIWVKDTQIDRVREFAAQCNMDEARREAGS